MKKVRSTLFTLLRGGIALGLLAYLGFSGAIDWSALTRLLAAWPLTLAALAIYFLAVAVVAWRLALLYRPHGIQLSVRSSLRLTLIGVFFSNCLPGAAGGDVVKIYYAAAGNNGRRVEVATIMLLDRVVGLFSLLILPFLFVPLLPGLLAASEVLRGLLWSAAALSVGVLVATVLTVALPISRHRLVAASLRRLPLGEYLARVLDTIYGYRRSPGTLLAAVAVSLVAQLGTIAVLILLAEAIAPGGATWQMALLIPFGLLANSIPLTPGGLGVGEAAFSALFGLVGLQGGAEMLLSWRLVLLIIGALGLGIYLQGRKQFIEASPDRPAETEPPQPGQLPTWRREKAADLTTTRRGASPPGLPGLVPGSQRAAPSRTTSSTTP